MDCNKHNYNTIQPTLQCTVTCTPIDWHAWVLRKRSRIFQTGIYYLFLSTDAHSTSTPRKAASLDDYFRPKQGENVGLLITLQISNAKCEVILYLIFPNTLEPITDLWEKQREKFWNAWLYWECNSYHHQLSYAHLHWEWNLNNKKLHQLIVDLFSIYRCTLYKHTIEKKTSIRCFF